MSTAARRAGGIGLCWVATPALLAAQGGLLGTFDAPGPAANHGAAVAAGGDVDGDGIGDWLIGTPLGDAGAPDGGAVEVRSGADGAWIRTHAGTAAGEELGFSVALLGDVDGDGRADVAAGSRTSNVVRVWSGATGSPWLTLPGDAPGDQFGFALAGLGDVDGDGRADLAIGVPGGDLGATDAGYVRIVSGRDGATLRTLVGVGLSTELGYAVAAAGDVDGDGVPDVIAGTSTGSNLAEVFSGATGARLHTFFGDSSIDWFGTAVAGAGDVDLDGRADLAVGAPQALLGPGYVRVFSGATGAVLRTHVGAAQLDLFGWSLAPAGDVDGDGRGDLLIGAPFAETLSRLGALLFNAGEITIVSGASGAILGRFAGRADDELVGWSAGGAPCAQGIAGAPSAGAGGRAYAFDTRQVPGWSNYCAANPSSLGVAARIEAAGTTSLAADDLTLIAVQLPPNTLGLFFHGRSPAQVAFGNGYRCIAGPVVRRGAIQASAAGVAQQPFAAGNLPPSARVRGGDVVRAQFWYRNPAGGGAGFNLTDGLRILFCP